MIKAKRAEGCNERDIEDLESRCGKFARGFPRDIATIRGFGIKTWLQEDRASSSPGGSSGG